MEKLHVTFSVLVLVTLASLSFFFFLDLMPRVSATVGTGLEEKLKSSTDQKWNKYTLDTPGCQIPGFEVMHENVTRYYEKIEPVQCETKPPLTFIKDGKLRINDEVKTRYAKTDVTCCYSYIYRVAQNWTQFDQGADSTIRYGTCRVFEEPVNLTEDFVRVKCYEGEEKVYKNTHATVCKRRLPKLHSRPENNASVLIIGLDSMSRLNFRRQMPQTLHFLEQMDFIEYLGYNKIGDNTFPNLVAVLTGYTTEEVRKCWKKDVYPMDDCPFVWKNYSQLNYTTFYAEDMPSWGTFTLNRLGFLAPPTDFYYRPYALAVRRLAKKETDLCYGYKQSMEHLLDYTKDFAVAHKKVPYFALSWGVRLSHDDLNEPQLADPLYYDLFSKLNKSGVFKDSVVIFMSDHGLRFGKFRTTYLGFVEERLPALWVRFPDWFSRAYPTAMANFRANSHKLTSPYDLHQTLLDLLNVTQLTKPSAASKASHLHGQSLFTVISRERTCKDAGIDDIWCTCYQHVPVPVSDPAIQNASRAIVQALNERLKVKKECAELSLDKVLEARWMTNQMANETSVNKRQYVVRFQTMPGKAEIETLVEHDTTADTFKLTGTVSRLNRYFEQSHCIGHPGLKLYCYCKDLLD